MLAFTLARKNFRENDQLITFYTKEHGKIETIARGVKRIVSKNAPTLESFSLLDIEVVPGKKYSYVTKTQVIEGFQNIREDLEKMLAIGFVLDVLKNLIKTGENDQNVFKLLHSYEKFLHSVKKISPLVPAAFVGRLACFLGFTPVFGSCVFCNSKLSKPEFFSVSAGGTVCSKCAATRKDEVVKVTVDVLKKVRSTLTDNWEKITDKGIKEDERELVLGLIADHFNYHLGVAVKFPQLKNA
jgi:DNA repair protein RecO (recombination protein O)